VPPFIDWGLLHLKKDSVKLYSICVFLRKL